MRDIKLLNQLLIVVCLIAAVLCAESTTDRSNETTKSATTKAPPITDSPQPHFTHELPSSTTTDVCGMSLISTSEQQGMKHQKCKCNNLNEDVDCSDIGLTELPKLISFPKSTRNVNFGGNQIENLLDDIFYNGRNVFELDLSHNSIDFVSTHAFTAFKSLRRLDLSHNKIWHLPEKSFQGLSELEYLDLGYNDISSITSDLFTVTNGLRKLNLECNPLRELEPKLLEHLPKLEFLDLEATMLEVIPDHIFIFTPKLRRLNLASNQLGEIPTDALAALDHLKWLDISGNPVSSIPGEAFIGMRGLILLYIDRMPLLKKIEKYAFGDLQQLQELHCSYNFLLSEIDENAFVRKVDNKKVPLSQLFLRQNALTTLPKDLLQWDDEAELHMESNSLSCDCHTEWMVNLKLKNEFQKHTRCSSPSHLEGIPLSKLKDHDLSCGLELSEIVMITSSVIISLLILALIVAFLVWRRNYPGYSKPYFRVPKKKNADEVDYRGDDDI